MTLVRCLAVLLFVTCLAVPAEVLADSSRLVAGDMIAVTVDGEKDFSKSCQVNRDGRITLPMVKPIEVAGLSTAEAAKRIAEALSVVLKNPDVTVTFVERAKMQVFVVGQVSKPGVVDIGAGDRVVQALAQVGYDDTADLAHVSVRRDDRAIELNLKKYLSGEDLTVNIELESGDTVVVPRADSDGTVMVLGQVSKTGAVPLKKGMTFRELMGLIGDVTVEADTEKITIRRQAAAEPLAVDYKRAMDADPTADTVLQPGDIIYVPQIETAFFTILGGVNRPGQYPLKGKLTLTQAIGLAGGAVPHEGDLRKVQLMSAGEETDKSRTRMIDLTKTLQTGVEEPLVHRGDVIYVTQHKGKAGLLDVINTVLPLGWLLL